MKRETHPEAYDYVVKSGRSPKIVDGMLDSLVIGLWEDHTSAQAGKPRKPMKFMQNEGMIDENGSDVLGPTYLGYSNETYAEAVSREAKERGLSEETIMEFFRKSFDDENKDDEGGYFQEAVYGQYDDEDEAIQESAGTLYENLENYLLDYHMKAEDRVCEQIKADFEADFEIEFQKVITTIGSVVTEAFDNAKVGFKYPEAVKAGIAKAKELNVSPLTEWFVETAVNAIHDDDYGFRVKSTDRRQTVIRLIEEVTDQRIPDEVRNAVPNSFDTFTAIQEHNQSIFNQLETEAKEQLSSKELIPFKEAQESGDEDEAIQETTTEEETLPDDFIDSIMKNIDRVFAEAAQVNVKSVWLTDNFQKLWKHYGLSLDYQREIRTKIWNDPEVGRVVRGLNGVRKFRIEAPPNAGKGNRNNTGTSGGYRIYYKYISGNQTQYLVYIDQKGSGPNQDSLTPKEERFIRQEVENLENLINGGVSL